MPHTYGDQVINESDNPFSKIDKDERDALMAALFGSWVDSGQEDKIIEEIYRRRLLPSTMPEEE